MEAPCGACRSKGCTHILTKYSLYSWNRSGHFHKEAVTPSHYKSNSYNIIMYFPRNVNLPSQTPGEAGSHNLHARGQILSQYLGRRSVLDHLLYSSSGGTGFINLVFVFQWRVRRLSWTQTIRSVHKYSMSWGYLGITWNSSTWELELTELEVRLGSSLVSKQDWRTGDWLSGRWHLARSRSWVWFLALGKTDKALIDEQQLHVFSCPRCLFSLFCTLYPLSFVSSKVLPTCWI